MNRYAIYLTLPKGPLDDFCTAWLGWDAKTGSARQHPDISDLPAPISEITETPRKYGVHGTIKPPFRLAQGQNAEALTHAFGEFCAQQAPFELDSLQLAPLGRFLALVPVGDTTKLASLASDTVRALDKFRAEPTPDERAKRLSRPLSDRQHANLTQWGYPYVMEDFRFHITLSGRLSKETLAQVEAVLSSELAPLLPSPFPVDNLTLCGEDDAGMFHEITRLPLTG